ncbi:four helix bundle protein [Litoribacter alkaliphilus]|uniref:Four helix bundle protein n=1 Tax=Litoribacter ruber TaxID=702568 RepID=A0AAP2G595_9BACT|nr:four helix bundle protein [Litoribacter alkaliphilus]MBS9524871.1 four helix bundle protein [Litoribacter alkaliphilus]
MNRTYDLEERLINFAVLVIDLTENIEQSKAGNHLAGQLLRSGTSPALNYGEAQSGESKRDFLHKIKIVLKELRETLVCLKLIFRSKLFKDEALVTNTMKECNELVSIFVKSVATTSKNLT